MLVDITDLMSDTDVTKKILKNQGRKRLGNERITLNKISDNNKKSAVGNRPSEFNNKGFTLLEVLIAMAVLNILLGAMFVVCQSGVRMYYQQERLINAQQNARYAMNQICSCIRQATGPPVLKKSNVAHYDILNCKIADLNKKGIFTGSVREIEISMQNGALRRKIGSNDIQPFASGIEKVVYWQTETGLIVIEITAGDSSGNRFTLQSAAKPVAAE